MQFLAASKAFTLLAVTEKRGATRWGYFSSWCDLSPFDGKCLRKPLVCLRILISSQIFWIPAISRGRQRDKRDKEKSLPRKVIYFKALYPCRVAAKNLAHERIYVCLFCLIVSLIINSYIKHNVNLFLSETLRRQIFQTETNLTGEIIEEHRFSCFGRPCVFFLRPDASFLPKITLLAPRYFFLSQAILFGCGAGDSLMVWLGLRAQHSFRLGHKRWFICWVICEQWILKKYLGSEFFLTQLVRKPYSVRAFSGFHKTRVRGEG